MRIDRKNTDDGKSAAFLNGEDNNRESAGNGIENDVKIWQSAGDIYSYSKSDVDLAWDNIDRSILQEENKSPYGKKIFLRVLKYAAIVVMVLGLGLLGYIVTQPSAEKQIALVTKQTESRPDSPSTVVLPDGSEITLNAGTIIEYPEKFGKDERRVKLVGEAFFSISKDIERPFIIDANGAVIEVLGTSFNVRSYNKSPKVEVNVKTGKVKVKSALSGDGKILLAGYSGYVDKSTGLTEVSEGLKPNYLSWLTREMEFDNTPLNEVFNVLENTYHISILSGSQGIDTLPTTVGFAKHDIDHVLAVIAKMHSLEVNETANGYLFTKR